ncbi:MAG: ABC transporter ATP-binding protein, partial [Clostridia bacterium]|nr:ABC transporter ATP-binding protein [Clostridia bacterium]
MARTLEQLQKQYSRSSRRAPGGMPGGPMGPRRGPGPGGPRAHGKPKNMRQTVARIWSYVSAYKFRLIPVFLCMLLSTCTSLIGAYMMAPIINRITLVINPTAELAPSPAERLADKAITALTSPVSSLLGQSRLGDVAIYILTALIILLSVYLVGAICTYVQARLMLSLSQGATERIRNDLFDKMQNLPVRYFDANPTGEIMSRYTNDVDNIDVMLNNTLTSFVSGVITLIGTFVFMLTTSWILTLVTVFFLPIFAFGGALIGKRSSKYYSGQQAALGAVNGYMEETITGQKVIKVFNHEDTCVEEFETLNVDMRDKQVRAQVWGGFMGPIMGNTSQVSYALKVCL